MKPKRWSFWLLSATALLSIGAWQAAQIAIDVKTRAASAVKEPPKKTHSGGRKPSAKELAQADPVGTYIARVKRGMTDQEILWIDEDFQEAGLDRLPPPLMPLQRAFRLRQHTWYAGALAEGLSLTQAQQKEMTTSLERLLAAEFDEGNDKTPSSIWASNILSSWLEKEAYAPWNLCHLTPAQTSLTTKQAWMEEQGLFENNHWFVIWAFPKIQDPATGRQTPFINTSPRSDTQNPSHLYLPGTRILPLTRDQAVSVPENPEAATLPAAREDQAHRYSPAQYRLALLLGGFSRSDHPPVATESSEPQTPPDE